MYPSITVFIEVSINHRQCPETRTHSHLQSPCSVPDLCLRLVIIALTCQESQVKPIECLGRLMLVVKPMGAKHLYCSLDNSLPLSALQSQFRERERENQEDKGHWPRRIHLNQDFSCSA